MDKKVLRYKCHEAADDYAKIIKVNEFGERYIDYDTSKLDGFREGFDYAVKLLTESR